MACGLGQPIVRTIDDLFYGTLLPAKGKTKRIRALSYPPLRILDKYEKIDDIIIDHLCCSAVSFTHLVRQAKQAVRAVGTSNITTTSAMPYTNEASRYLLKQADCKINKINSEWTGQKRLPLRPSTGYSDEIFMQPALCE